MENHKAKGFFANIEEETLKNKFFRKVLYTSHHCQLVIMRLAPGEEIGMETHSDNDQFFRFEMGKGKCIINGCSYFVEEGSAVIIPAGSRHNIINTSKNEDLKMYTIYSPPHHMDKVLHATKREAERDGEEFDGVISE
jgi:mannose-6-phosphate isomerase-like protein (cupin superfamily)